MKVGAATAPACDAVEWVSRQHVLLQEKRLVNEKISRRMTKGDNVTEDFWGVFFTLVFGWMMVTPCLLMAMRTISGKFSSDVCWRES